ncbi:MAG: MaoC/PaaZ C-terminal domain-containing protein [Acidimicrobiales bacterium]
MATIVNGLDELKAKVGEHLGYSEWHTISQEQVNLFADATGDHQWIHIDVERAKAGPFGGYRPRVLTSADADADGRDPAAEGHQHGRQLRRQQSPLHVTGAGRLQPAHGGPSCSAWTTSPVACSTSWS